MSGRRQARPIGSAHNLRIHCFGDIVRAVELNSKRLDWRFDLNIPMNEVDLAAQTKDQLRAVLDMLSLRMGIFDFKITPDGELVWLEVNPQGQYLFIEALTGVPLTDEIATFLRNEAVVGRERRLATEKRDVCSPRSGTRTSEVRASLAG